MENSANLGLPFIEPNQAQKHVTHNEALRLLDALVQIGVAGRGTGNPPTNPEEGERHIVGAGASGLWAGQEDALAVQIEGVWIFHAPRPGWVAWVGDEATLIAWDGNAWVPATAGTTGAPLFGINTAADATNRLAVKSDAVLLSHDDVTPGSGDARVVVNKAGPGNTGAVLFQSAWSGRAEFGLSGDDDWHVKVSPDGSGWTEALLIDAQTGNVGFSNPAPKCPVDAGGPVRMGQYSVAALPDPAACGAGALAFVSDAAGGAIVAFSDGTDWRRVTDRTVVTV